jgi:hypothetical protein
MRDKHDIKEAVYSVSVLVQAECNGSKRRRAQYLGGFHIIPMCDIIHRYPSENEALYIPTVSQLYRYRQSHTKDGYCLKGCRDDWHAQ